MRICRQHLVADMVVSQSQNKTSKGENGDNKKFLLHLIIVIVEFG